MINADEISARCFLAGLPDSEAGKILNFCKKKNIRHIFSPHKFVLAWRNNPKRPEIELNQRVKEKEKTLAREKDALMAAMSRMFKSSGIDATAAVKVIPSPRINVNSERNRILNQLGVK